MCFEQSKLFFVLPASLLLVCSLKWRVISIAKKNIEKAFHVVL